METTRQRRAHQACEPCRRKKVKCPGERPICSFCRRLRQACEYRPNEPDVIQVAQNRMIEQRMGTIEGKLDQLLQSLNPPRPSTHSARPSVSSLASGPSEELPDAPQTSQDQTGHSSALSSPEDHDLLETGRLYQIWCHGQPLSLFKQAGFLESLANRDRELCLSIQALSCRFPPGALTPEKQVLIDQMAKSSRTTVMDRVAGGKIRLSTLQSLCILSMIEYSDGRVMQAGLDLGMAHYFVSSLPHGSALGNPEEFSLCVESILLLQNIQGCIRDAAKPTGQISPMRNDSQSSGPFNYRTIRPPFRLELGNEQNPEIGILPYVAQAAEAWQMARAYAASHVGPDEPPPWHPQSDYSLIMLRHMELDSQYPVKYRFATNNFGGLTPEALQQRREYWGPWLFQQFVYSAIPSLVNHPFLLSMRLKNFRHMMPQTFIHQSFDQISRHSTWIICFLDLVEKQQFQISDPLVAHCVAIVATIHLQHAFVLDDTLRQKAQNGYDKCMRFLDRMGAIWPCVASMAQNLRKLQDSIIMVPSPAGEGNPTQEPHLSWTIDAQLLWDILISEKAVRRDAESDCSMFDDTITLEAEHRDHDVAEFAMVGSAGISGHKTVPKEVNAYAPEDDERYHRMTSSTTPAEAALGGLNVTDNRLFEGFEDMNQMMDQDNSFLQAEDFGKAINDWFSFDL